MSHLFKKGKLSTLYVGLDESNHHSYRGEEIIVATFSFDPCDAKKRLILHSKTHRNYSEMANWLSKRRREYLFTLWPNGKELEPSPNYLVRAAPKLILTYLSHLEKQNHFEIEKVSIHLDGKLESASREFLESSLTELLSISFSIAEHPKGKKGKTINYPKIVEIADTLSNYLYRASFREGSFMLHDLRQYVPALI